ncbi:effector-associated constant component EACC1 [Kitasatospora purpeofusca]|uniref:effector-associated constant component EACC1 n=1 Tax=Kitasatospora purpeofusca TaxID=67352 RepID=UPI0035D6AD58
MDARIAIAGGDPEDLPSLYEWLVGEDELRGLVRISQRPIGQTELGSAVDLLTVALGAGGAGSVLSSALITWLRARRTSAKVTVEAEGRSVTLEIETLRDVSALLEQVLGTDDRHDTDRDA